MELQFSPKQKSLARLTRMHSSFYNLHGRTISGTSSHAFPIRFWAQSHPQPSLLAQTRLQWASMADTQKLLSFRRRRLPHAHVLSVSLPATSPRRGLRPHRVGNTRVLCNATIEQGVPLAAQQWPGLGHRRYGMLPRATLTRTAANRNAERSAAVLTRSSGSLAGPCAPSSI